MVGFFLRWDYSTLRLLGNKFLRMFIFSVFGIVISILNVLNIFNTEYKLLNGN